jgi:hypothetical protein
MNLKRTAPSLGQPHPRRRDFVERFWRPSLWDGPDSLVAPSTLVGPIQEERRVCQAPASANDRQTGHRVVTCESLCVHA